MRIPADLPRRWRTYWPDADVERMARDVEARVDDAIATRGLTGAHLLRGGHVGAVLATRDLVLKVSPRGHDDDVLVASQPDALEHWRPTGIVPSSTAVATTASPTSCSACGRARRSTT